MSPSLYLIWSQINNTLIGLDINSAFTTNPALQGITFPNQSTGPLRIQLSSSARDLHNFSTLQGIKFYLDGDPDQIDIVQRIWPISNGGLNISFNGGLSYNTFNTTYGYKTDPSTWVLLPATAIGSNAIDGSLGIFDAATLLVKYVIPENADQFAIYNVALTCDFDVI